MAASGTLLSDLFKEHKADIDDLLAQVSSYLQDKNDPELHASAREMPLDEFSVLKFLLSALRKKEKAKQVAFDNLVATLAFRAKYKESMEKAKNSKELLSIVEQSIGGFLGDDLIMVGYYGLIDMHEVKNKYETVEGVFCQAIIPIEQIRLMIDRRSRETGRLTKVISVVDLEHLSLSKASNMTVIKAMGMVSKSNEVNYPQWLSRAVMLHASMTFRTLFSMSKPLISKNSLEKIVICGIRKGDQDCSVCPFIKKFVDGPSKVPKDIGGTLPVTKIWH